MAEFSEENLNDLNSQIGKLASQFSTFGNSFTSISTELSNLSTSINLLVKNKLKKVNDELSRVESSKLRDIGNIISKFGDVYELSSSELQKVANQLGRRDIENALSELENTGQLEEDLNEYRKKIADEMNQQLTNLAKYQDLLVETVKKQTLLGNTIDEVNTKYDLLQKTTGNVRARTLIYGDILLRLGIELTKLRDRIYDIQAKLGTTFATAFDKTIGAATQVIASYFREGPALTADDTINAINAFQKEFGMLLTTGEAGRLAQQAKALGTNADAYFKAQRAFLGAGGVGGVQATQRAFITQFRAAGLTANQALVFAANNANLVAIAGTKYANELARAAANAQRIGVGLDKTEQLADSIVGDFEGALERFSELRAMGVEVDFNRLAGVAATGTPEEIVKELSNQFGGNKALLEEVQRNRFLKVAIERDLGLSIADVKKLALGPGAVPEAQTTQEKNEESLTTISKWLPLLTKGIGALTIALAVNKGVELAKSLATAGGALGTAFGGPVGTAIGAGIGFAAGSLFMGAGKATGGMITGPGTATSDNILTPTSPGEFVVNARATEMYGAGMLNDINRGTYQQPVNNVVNVDVSKLETKLDRVVSAISNMKVMMDANTVGKIVVNSSSPIDLATA